MHSMLITLYLVIFACNSYSFVKGKIIDDDDDFKCPKYFVTNNYDYNETYLINDMKFDDGYYLAFLVKANRDAIIILSAGDKPAKKGEEAYEIVIGAENNRASYIRRQRLGYSVRNFTSGVLSNETWRYFSIRTYANGLIEVKGEDDAPVVSWKDDKPLAIKHYGFASWENFKVEWSLQCPLIPKPKDMAKLLIKSFFAGNKTYPLPRNVTITYVNFALNLDNPRYARMEGTLNVSWKSDFKWNVSDYGITSLSIEVTRIPPPPLEFENQLMFHKGNVTISPDGTVMWSRTLHEVISCYPDRSVPNLTHRLECFLHIEGRGINLKFGIREPPPHLKWKSTLIVNSYRPAPRNNGFYLNCTYTY